VGLRAKILKKEWNSAYAKLIKARVKQPFGRLKGPGFSFSMVSELVELAVKLRDQI